MVKMGPAILAFFQDGGTGRLGKARCHDTKRFAGNVTVKGGDNVHGFIQSFVISPSPQPSPTKGEGVSYKGEEKK